MSHRYLFSYQAQTLDGRGTFTGQGVIPLKVPFSPEHLPEVCKLLQSTCPVAVGAVTITSVWKFEA